MQPTPGCFFACWNTVLIIFIYLHKRKLTKQNWKKTKLKAIFWWKCPFECLGFIERAVCLLKYTMLASTVKPVANLSPPLCPSPSLPLDESEGREGGGGGTVLILIITSVQDTVCVHWGSLGTQCPKVFCYITTKLPDSYWHNKYKSHFSKQFLLEVSHCAAVVQPASCVDLTPTVLTLFWTVSCCIGIYKMASHCFYG